MSANFPRVIFEDFISIAGELSTQLARATEDNIEVVLFAVAELIELLPKSKIVDEKIKEFLSTPNLHADLDEEDIALISRATKILTALAADMTEARLALKKRGILPSDNNPEAK